MKKWKKGLALAGAVFILVIFCMPMYFALTDQFSMEKFMASLMADVYKRQAGGRRDRDAELPHPEEQCGRSLS